jgi:hypothetical protein
MWYPVVITEMAPKFLHAHVVLLRHNQVLHEPLLQRCKVDQIVLQARQGAFLSARFVVYLLNLIRVHLVLEDIPQNRIDSRMRALFHRVGTQTQPAQVTWIYGAVADANVPEEGSWNKTACSLSLSHSPFLWLDRELQQERVSSFIEECEP